MNKKLVREVKSGGPAAAGPVIDGNLCYPGILGCLIGNNIASIIQLLQIMKLQGKSEKGEVKDDLRSKQVNQENVTISNIKGEEA